MDLARFLRHSLVPQWWALRVLPRGMLDAVERAIGESEKRHSGELRFVIEGPLPAAVLAGRSSRQRALDLFSQLRVWDTADNSGVLIYLQLIDRRVEIVADRGIDARVGGEFWRGVCRKVESAFQAGEFERGTLLALNTITEALREHFPAPGENPDELPNAALLL